jgi:hypothetical protein
VQPTAPILAATIGFATINAIVAAASVGVPANMQMALPIRIKKQKTAMPRGTFALTGTTGALL